MGDFTTFNESLYEILSVDLLQQREQHYAHCIFSNGSPLPNCVAFLDRTKVFRTRLRRSYLNEKACALGLKRGHCLVYITVTSLDGLSLHLYGTESGRRHNMTIFWQSSLDGILAKLFDCRWATVLPILNFYVKMRPWL